jgi:type IV secretory pathway component VirB8
MTTIRVQHKMIHDKYGIAKYVTGRETIEKVVCTYRNGMVKTQSGDVWNVLPDSKSKATFESVGR